MTHTPHDALFKYVFSKPRHAAGELRAALPKALLAALDLETLEDKTRELLGPDLEARHCDLLFKVQLRGLEAYLFILHEHQTQLQHLLLARVQVYAGRILDDWLRDHPPGATRIPAFLALVLYPGPGRWTGPRELRELYDLPQALASALRDHLPGLRILLDELGGEPDDDLRAREATPLSKLGWLLLKHDRLGDLTEELLRSLSDLFHEVERTGSEQDVEALCRYALDRTTVAEEELVTIMSESGSEKTREVIMTTGERLRQQGEQRLLLEQLRELFGDVPPETERRVRRANESELSLWGKRVLRASSLDEVFAAEET